MECGHPDEAEQEEQATVLVAGSDRCALLCRFQL